jgi:hypothetical protein
MMIMEMTTVEMTPQEKTMVHTSSMEIRRDTEAAGVLISVATIRKQRRKTSSSRPTKRIRYEDQQRHFAIVEENPITS